MKQKPTKKKVSLKKLSLNKETIAELNSDKMNGVKGGSHFLRCTFSFYVVNCKEPW